MSVEFAPEVGFKWISRLGNEIIVEYPFPEPTIRALPTDTLIYVLWAAEHKESEVVQVSVDGKNCGWFFTVSSMLTATDTESQYFRAAVWGAVAHLISSRAHEIEDICNARGAISCKLSDFVDDELSVLALYKPSLSQALIDNPNSIIPKLMSLGIYAYVDGRTKSLVTPPFKSPGARLNLLSGTAIEPFGDFHVDLLMNHIPYVDNEVFKFYLYYQIIESLMEVVAMEVCQDTLAQVASSQGDPMQSYNILSKYKDRSSEKYRIGLVFNNFLSATLECTDQLMSECINFILSVDSSIAREELEKNKNVASHFYAVRNQIIHNFRRVGTSTIHLKKIVNVLDIVVPDLLCKFKRASVAT